MQKPVTRLISSSTDPAMAAVKRIYESVFPASERRPTHCLDQMADQRQYKFIVTERDQTAVGFAALFLPENLADAALLEYLAIHPDHQGGGIGSGLVHTALDLADGRAILVEVEASEEISAQRRRAFYRRLGFRRLIGLSYLLPIPNAPPMELMLVNGPRQIDRKTLADWLTTLYQSVYGCNGDDTRLIKMLSQLSPEI